MSLLAAGLMSPQNIELRSLCALLRLKANCRPTARCIK
jgi:hypothetical protein